jgi:hypothetical protein
MAIEQETADGVGKQLVEDKNTASSPRSFEEVGRAEKSMGSRMNEVMNLSASSQRAVPCYLEQ